MFRRGEAETETALGNENDETDRCHFGIRRNCGPTNRPALYSETQNIIGTRASEPRLKRNPRAFLFKNVGPRLSAANRTITGGSVTKPRTAHKRIPNLGNTRGRALPFCSPPRHATPPVVCPLVALESKHCSYLAALPCVAFASKWGQRGAAAHP